MFVGGNERTQAFELGADLGAFVLRWLRRLKGSGLEGGVFEGAVEPDPELSTELESGEGASVVVRECVFDGVARAADLGKELSDFAREVAIVLQAAEKVVLRLFGGGELAKMGGGELGEEFGELTELEERGVRVVRKVLLSKQPKAEQLLIVRAEVAEVGGGGRCGHAADQRRTDGSPNAAARRMALWCARIEPPNVLSARTVWRKCGFGGKGLSREPRLLQHRDDPLRSQGPSPDGASYAVTALAGAKSSSSALVGIAAGGP